MHIYDQQKLKINEKFINSQVPGTGKCIPKPGYYYVRNINFKDVGIDGEVAIAEVNWKVNLDDLFIEEAIFEVALNNLAKNILEEDANRIYNELLGKTLFLYDPTTIRQKINDVESATVLFKANFISQTPRFLNQRNAAINAIASNVQFGSELYDYLIRTSPYDLQEALYHEANGAGDSYDDPEEQDVYDAPQ